MAGGDNHRPPGAGGPPGWLDLPSGCAVHLTAGFADAVTDRGDWNLDEGTLLAEATTITDQKLAWTHLKRTRRWHSAGLGALFAASDQWLWSIAAVSLAACEDCAAAAGEAWVREPPGAPRRWLCPDCAARRRAGETDTEDEPGSAG